MAQTPKRDTAERPNGDAGALELPSGPLVGVVSLKQQTFSLYAGSRLVRSTSVSSGVSEHPTPIGIYGILEKNREHWSNIYDAEMPFMQRLTWSGIALHEGRVTGRPASHGCVRLPGAFASELFGITSVGMRVVIAHSHTQPVEIAHDALLVPRVPAGSSEARDAVLETVAGAAPADEPLRGEALSAARKAARATARTAAKADEDVKTSAAVPLAEIARLTKAVEAAERAARLEDRAVQQAEGRLADPARAVAMREKLEKVLEATKAKRAAAELRLSEAKAALAAKREANAELLTAVEVSEAQARTTWEAYRRLMRIGEPVAVLISAKTGLLQVRQAYDPIFEMPVTIADRGGAPLGTHVFTLVSVSAPIVVASDAETPLPATGRAWTVVTMPTVDQPPTEARAALDRIEMPAAARARLEPLLVAGSSIILTDDGASPETGKFTNFIVELNQPQPVPDGPVVRERSGVSATASASRPVSRPAASASYRTLPVTQLMQDR